MPNHAKFWRWYGEYTKTVPLSDRISTAYDKSKEVNMINARKR